jgi:F-type H+-transporting ATPase subunit b
MLIDWFTVFAQIVNFLVLVALLKHFLYGRILRAMDDRESRIAARISTAEEQNRLAKFELEKCECKSQELEAKREELLAEARQQAAEKHAQLLDQARESVSALEQRWRDELKKEKRATIDDLRRRLAGQVIAITRRAVTDLADADLERQAIRVFLNKLRGIKIPELVRDEELVVSSGVDLDQSVRQEIRTVLEAQLGAVPRLRFDRLGSGWGIELHAGGWKIGWSSETYLDAIENNLSGTLLDRESEVAFAK